MRKTIKNKWHYRRGLGGGLLLGGDVGRRRRRRRRLLLRCRRFRFLLDGRFGVGGGVGGRDDRRLLWSTTESGSIAFAMDSITGFYWVSRGLEGLFFRH